MRYQDEIDVKRSPEEVFGYVSDFPRHAEWSSHGLQVTQDDDGPAKVGTNFSTVAKLFGTQRERSMIVQIEPPSAFAWESRGSLGTIRHWFEVAGEADSARLVKGLEVLEPTLLAKMMGFRLKKDIPKALRTDLEKIKDMLER